MTPVRKTIPVAQPVAEVSIEGIANGTSNAASAAADEPRMSGWAIAALGTSLALFCPLLTLIGPLLAIRALVEIRAHPTRGGRILAITAIWIGVAATIGWIALIIWWNANVRGALLRGPEDALLAGYAGDISGFRTAFIGDGATASDEHVRAFISTLREHHGSFQSATQDQMVMPPAQSGGRSVVIPYVLTFDSGTVRAEAGVRLFAEWLRPKLESITVKDEQSVIEYP
jgi:hypothetical protein